MGPTPDGPIGAYVRDLLARVTPIAEGAVADYIPMLASADPDLFGIAIATTDGTVYAAGDVDHAFTIQSVSKPFMYGLALETLGREAVMKHVGVEPTGSAFNATLLDEDNNRPFNPMVNAGAIAVSALIPGASYAAKRARMLAEFEQYAGKRLSIDEAVFQSERETGERNRAIAALMAQAAMLEGNTEEILDLYFSQCSVLVSCRDLALMAATLANNGVQPNTGVRALTQEFVHDVLTVMNSCGMYNYAGTWSYEVGVPAKSGVAGSIIAVIPGQIGIAAFSPRLDRFGNSVRAIAACKEIARDFGLHVFRTAPDGSAALRGEWRGDAVRSKRRRGAAERDLLDAAGGRIAILEAQGPLFFASAERIVRRASALAGEASHVILDLRRIFSADQAAARLLLALHDDMAGRGTKLVFVHPDPVLVDAGFEQGLFDRVQETPHILFNERDAALEWCESALIAAAPKAREGVNFSLAGLDLFGGLAAENVKLLENLARPFVFEAGQAIVREGEAAQLFFVIAQGSASVRLTLPAPGGPRSVRVAAIGAGAAIGEMALLDGGARSADVVADERVVAYGFSVEELRAQAPPPLLLALYANLARDMAARLRGANGHIRALEQ